MLCLYFNAFLKYIFSDVSSIPFIKDITVIHQIHLAAIYKGYVTLNGTS